MHFLLNRPPARRVKEGRTTGVRSHGASSNSIIIFIIIHLKLDGSVWTTEQPPATVWTELNVDAPDTTMDSMSKDMGGALPPKGPVAGDAKGPNDAAPGHRSWISRVGTWGSDLVNAVGGAVGDGLNYLAGYDELEVTEGGDDAHAGTHTEVDAVDDRKQMWAQLKDMLGSDIMSMFSLPTFLMEPISTLQKMAEIMQYQRLLDEANEEEDPDVRLAKVTAFAVAVYSTMERSKKPFNPILGETFELKMEDGSTYLAEQVSHHPPIGAGHVKTKNFTYDITSAVTTKFAGNWVDVYPVGRTRITLHKTGETFNIVPPSSRVNNLIIGRIWIDTFGEMKVLNLTTGARAELDFKACGIMSFARYVCSGEIIRPDGTTALTVDGHWNSDLSYTRVGENKKVSLWECDPWPTTPNKYGFTTYAIKMNEMSSAPEYGLMASDSRLRPDRIALDKGDSSATALKTQLEERQRAERRERKEKGDTWSPRWFKKAEHADLHELEKDVGTDVWEYNGEYDANKPEGSATEFSPWQYAK